MAWTWSARLLALGGLAVALGCRSQPAAPPCTTPLLPGEVVPGPVHLMPGPPIPSAPPLGAQLPRPSEVKPGVLAPPQYAKLPESTYPTTKPPLKLVETAPPAGVSDLPPILPPKDVKPLLTSNPKPVELPAPSLPVKPPLIEAPRSKVGGDGFGPGPRLPAAATEPVVVVPPTQAANVDPALPLKSGEKFGHAPDYRWIAGIVDRHLKGAYFTIRYADIGTDDLWGGKVRLLDDDRLRDLRNGDLVYVEGEVMAPKSAAETSAYPPYRVTSVRVIERNR
jgi:hypothetical protein